MLNFLMENFVFTYIGVSVFTFHKHSWNAGYILLSFVSFLCSRWFSMISSQLIFLNLSDVVQDMTFKLHPLLHFLAVLFL